jgi:hypothetical protein
MKNMQKKDNKKTLIYGTDDIFFEVVSQVTGENQFGSDETTFSSLRVHATPNSKTPQIPNVIPLASNYLKNWQGAGPLHDLRQDEYSAVLDKKGLVRCALVETDHKERDPTEYALENKAYSWQYGAWSEPIKVSEDNLEQGFCPMATIQQGNFIFSFFQRNGKGKVLIWTVESFEKALRSGKLQWEKSSAYHWDEAVRLTVEPTSLSPVEESTKPTSPHWSSFPEGHNDQIQFTFGAALETIQAAFDWHDPFVFCWVGFQAEEGPSKVKALPVKIAWPQVISDLTKSLWSEPNIHERPLDYVNQRQGTGLEFTEGYVYMIARDSYCKGGDRWDDWILAWFETPNLDTRYWFSLSEATQEEAFEEALNQAEKSTTFVTLEEINFEEERT